MERDKHYADRKEVGEQEDRTAEMMFNAISGDTLGKAYASEGSPIDRMATFMVRGTEYLVNKGGPRVKAALCWVAGVDANESSPPAKSQR